MDLDSGPSAARPGCALGRLIQQLLPVGLQVLVDPPDPDDRVITPVIEDREEPLPEVPGGVLLLTGGTETGAVVASLQRAAANGYVAVIAKRRMFDVDIVGEEARSLGVAVLTIDGSVQWRELMVLIDATLAMTVADAEAGFGTDDDLYRIADMVAHATGGSAVVEDLDRKVIAYSSVPGQRIDPLRSQGILERRVPDLPENREMYHEVLRATGVVRFPEVGEELSRSAIAIRAGSVPLGTLWVIDSELDRNADADSALEAAARHASLHMLRARMAVEVDQVQRGQILRELFRAGDRSRPAADRLGLSERGPRALLAIAPRGSSLLRSAHLTQEVARQCHALGLDAVVTSLGQATYVLLLGRGADTEAVRLADSLLTPLERRIQGLPCIGIATAPSSERTLDQLRIEADDVLRVLLEGPADRRIATMADVRPSLLIRHLKDELERNPRLRQPAIVALVEDEPRRARVLLDSVEQWLRSHGDFRDAATRMRIHPNTLRYRVRKFVELTAIDLEDADQCLATWLEIRSIRESRADLR